MVGVFKNDSSTVLKSKRIIPEYWDYQVESFVPGYFQKEIGAYAVNTLKQPTDKWAAANYIFEGKTGIYNLEFTSILEIDGESSYKIFVDNKEILSVKNPRIFDKADDYKHYKWKAEKIKIKRGALIQVQFMPDSNKLIPEKGGFAFARGRWTNVEFIKVK
jgi:hypothetical protein